MASLDPKSFNYAMGHIVEELRAQADRPHTNRDGSPKSKSISTTGDNAPHTNAPHRRPPMRKPPVRAILGPLVRRHT